MSSPGDFAKMVPGFDFLQGLMKNAGSALPGMGQWIAPSLDPAELDKRIEELRTVQFWLEQNARMLSTTIQALEVQRMTLSTLKSMNVPVAELAEAFKIQTNSDGTRTYYIAADDIHRGIDVLSWRGEPNPVGAQAPASSTTAVNSGLLGASALVLTGAALYRRRRGHTV